MNEETITVTVITDSADEIRECHSMAVESMGKSVGHVAQAGILLINERDLRTGGFATWVEENLPFTRKTAYQYMKIGAAVDSGKLDLSTLTSVRQALKLLPNDSESSTRSKDKRMDSIPNLCLKIEQAFTEAVSSRPVSGWSVDEKETLLRSLDGILSIKEQLS